MEIKVKTQDKEGNVIFEGTLNQEQHNYILAIGIQYLLANGAMSLDGEDEDDDPASFAPGSDSVQ
jgi:hypothetical protein